MSPATSHLSFLKKTRLMCGLVEQKDLKWRNKPFLIFYRFYSTISKPIFLINLFLMLIKIFMETDNPRVVGETLSYSVLYIIMYISLMFIEAKDARAIFNNIDKEEKQMSTANESIREIYSKYTKINNSAGLQITIVTFTYCLLMTIHHTKILEGKRGFVFYQYLPFNPFNYYWFMVFNHVIYLGIALAFMMYTKLSVIAISTYVLAHVRVLQHFMTNLEHYAKHFADKEGVNINEGRYIVLKNWVIYHNNIIEYINMVRKKTSIFILIDFGMTSLQLGSILISLTVMENRFIDQCLLCYYFCLNIHWMYITYYYGIEVMIQSVNISSLIHTKLSWYKFNKRVNEGLILIMAKVQYPLSLSIGPLADLSLASFLTVIRATFSYMTFMQTLYRK